MHRLFQVSAKIILAIFLLLLLGLPILDSWKMFVLLAGWLALAYCNVRTAKWRVVACVVTVGILLVVKSILPRAGIEEGHNIFIYLKEGESLQKALPTEVFKAWKKFFDSLYPSESGKKQTRQNIAPYSWRLSGVVPESAFAYSSDSIWKPARYSRQVDTINFKSLREFRGGFANDLRYNWWQGNLDRRTMPFFAMYEFTAQSVGCKLHWKGTMFWERADGSFEKITNRDVSGKIITSDDVGRKTYILFLPKLSDSIFLHLGLSRKLLASHIAGNVLSIMGVLILFVLMTRIKWHQYCTAVCLISVGMVIIYLSVLENRTILFDRTRTSSWKPLGATYPPHSGGDDGLVHESHGRNIARMAMSGDLKESLMGLEEVYWFTPGMRYFRAVEKIFFGDTNLGYTAFLACMPWLIYLIINHLYGFRWGLLSSFIFLLSPVSFSFAQYIDISFLGYAEPVGSGLFFAGLFLFLKSQPLWGGNRSKLFAFIGGVCLAGSMFVRPNFAIAVPLLGSFFVFAGWRSRDFKIMLSAIAGLSFALWMPLHNYIYGHQFALISASRKMALPLSPITYIQAAYELISVNWDGQHLVKAFKQIWEWLFKLPELRHFSRAIAVLFSILRLPTLIVTIYFAFRPNWKQSNIFALAWVALAAHVPMLFVFSSRFRYAMLAWDLSAIVTIAVIANRGSLSFPQSYLFKSIKKTSTISR